LTPSVFNYYDPDYSPPGVIGNAGLYSPESQLLTPPYTIHYLNGMLGLINIGLHPDNAETGAGSGFGSYRQTASSYGTLMNQPGRPRVHPNVAI
jgi:hypothetical protein